MTWDAYPVERDGKPHWVSWDVDSFGRAPDRTRPVRLDVTVTFRAAQDDGLPGEEEYAALKELREAAARAIVSATDGFHVMRVTGGGRQVLTFYSPRQRGIFRKKSAKQLCEEGLAEVRAAVGDYSVHVASTEDEEWETYLEAFPSTDPTQWFADANELSRLGGLGLDLSEEAAVVHTLLLPNDEARESLRATATELGFEVLDAFDGELDPELPFALRVSRTEPQLDHHTVHRAVMSLQGPAIAAEGLHGGWVIPSFDGDDESE